MLPLDVYRSKRMGLPDLLPYAAVIEDGIVLNKDGSLMAGWFYRGKDLATVTVGERDFGAQLVNAALARLGSEWMIHVDAVRVSAVDYPDASRSAFPDPVTRLMDEARRKLFSSGQHYETVYALVVTFLPEKLVYNKAADLMLDTGVAGRNKGENRGRLMEKTVALFRAAVTDLEDRLSAVLVMTRLRGADTVLESGETQVRDGLLTYLHYALTGEAHPVNLPAVPMYLDAVIGGHEFATGIVPQLDDKLIKVIGIDGFPQESYQGILAALDQLPIPYRWSTRFILPRPDGCTKWAESVSPEMATAGAGFLRSVVSYIKRNSESRRYRDGARGRYRVSGSV
jgi:Type IV secretory pathway, VirB4 components